MTSRERLQKAIGDIRSLMDAGGTAELTCALAAVHRELEIVLQENVDFRQIVENIDDSIFVTDAKGDVFYVNPAYSRNTGVLPEEVLNRNVFDIVSEGRIFTGGASCDVIKSKNRVFRLSTTYKTDPPLVGYTIGVPIFDEIGQLSKVVVSSRPISTLKQLQGDFEQFIRNLEDIRKKDPVTIVSYGEDEANTRNMIGSSATIQPIWRIINRVATSDATILITGESGVGKEVVADQIYQRSQRIGKPYVKVNCAAIPAALLESELFGYDKGAFSGANSAGKPGLFEMADGGTLLLDEIGDLPLDLQAKLLRAIQNREVTRIGGTKSKRLNIRFLALTNSNLREKVALGTFRSDLFYRLNVIPIQVPPLRERPDDLKELIDYFLTVCGGKYGQRVELSVKSFAFLQRYQWPGNIRELENVLEYISLCCPDADIAQEEIVADLVRLGAPFGEGPELVTDLNGALAQYEETLIRKALKKTRNLRDAAEILGVNASTVSRKMKQYNMRGANLEE